MKNIKFLTVAAASLLASAAIAQQTTPTTTPANPATQPPAATAPATPAPAASFIGMQTADQMLASDLIGMSVRGAGNESIGEINDVVVARDGRVIGAVIGVGGFLGIGEKDVAVPFQAVEVSRDGDGNERLVLRKTRDELKAAPSFTKYERNAPAATGSVNNTNRPAGTPPTGTTPQAATPPATTPPASR